MKIFNKPTIHNAPTIYNLGGGGGGGNFPPLMPEEYKQILGVYLPHGCSPFANKEYNLNDVFGISLTDFSGIKVEIDGYNVEPVIEIVNPIYLFNIRATWPTAPVIRLGKLDKKIDNKDYLGIYGNNGQGTAYNATTYEVNGLGLWKATLSHNIGRINNFGTTFPYGSPINIPNACIYPFACLQASYDCKTNNISILSEKIYNSNGDLMLYFVPAKREADGICGLYDIVHGVFCDNSYSRELTSIN